ncbi:MAG: rod shape-determining protein MreD [Sulfuritalea sp.]|jgi:rod shape-determining protein MreD|nr:rod shape-determining protein MreD [Sulfuritalea sp.]
MPTNKLKSIYLSIILALILLLLPCSGFVLTMRPDFMLLVIIFWLIRAPNLCNVGTAWLVGLFVDLATGGVFGQYALAYTIAAFFAVTYQKRLVLFSSTQQLIYVFLLLFISQLIMLVIKTFAGAQFMGWTYFIPSITGVLLWFMAGLFGLDVGGRNRGN